LVRKKNPRVLQKNKKQRQAITKEGVEKPRKGGEFIKARTRGGAKRARGTGNKASNVTMNHTKRPKRSVKKRKKIGKTKKGEVEEIEEPNGGEARPTTGTGRLDVRRNSQPRRLGEKKVKVGKVGTEQNHFKEWTCASQPQKEKKKRGWSS